MNARRRSPAAFLVALLAHSTGGLSPVPVTGVGPLGRRVPAECILRSHVGSAGIAQTKWFGRSRVTPRAIFGRHCVILSLVVMCCLRLALHIIRGRCCEQFRSVVCRLPIEDCAADDELMSIVKQRVCGSRRVLSCCVRVRGQACGQRSSCSFRLLDVCEVELSSGPSLVVLVARRCARRCRSGRAGQQATRPTGRGWREKPGRPPAQE